MYKYLISEYIDKLTINDIINYCENNHIPINENEANILLSYAKKHYKTFLYDNPKDLLKELSQKINPITYKELYRLYIINKAKYID